MEISNFREGFERGEDPLADTTDASDINSVAGVLKLYLRELREPLFPIIYFDHFVTLARKYTQHIQTPSKIELHRIKFDFFFIRRTGIEARTCDGYTEILAEPSTIGCDCDALFICVLESVSAFYHVFF